MADKPKIAVIYYSATGHSYLVAKAVEGGGEGCGGGGTPSADSRDRTGRGDQHDAGLEGARRSDEGRAGSNSCRSRMGRRLRLRRTREIRSHGRAPQGILRERRRSVGIRQALEQAAAAFTGAINSHGGQETALHTIYNVMHHWGAVIVSPGFTDAAVYAAGGNPYGVSYSASREKTAVSEETLAAARYMGGRVARYAAVLAANRERLMPQPVGAHN